MKIHHRNIGITGIAIGTFFTGAMLISTAQAQQPEMTFFVTSAGPGNGGDLGGLDGADAHCGTLAAEAG